MSKQHKSRPNVTTIAFLLLVVSIGFPFQSLPLIDFDVNFKVESDLQIANLFLGNGFVGKSIFEPSTYDNQNIMPFAHAQVNGSSSTAVVFRDAIYQSQEDADPINDIVMGRGESSEVTQVGERKFVTSSGLTRWVNDTNGKYVERLVTDDVNGVKFESGIFSYYYDKEQCGMTVHDIGKIDEFNESFIKYNGWVVKSALNGTDTWTDLEQNNLDCVVTVIDNFESTKIISVRENTNGKFTETYEIPKPIKEMKTTLDFFNNDTALNNHKIAFTNILDATPEHFRFLLAVEDIADVIPEDMEDPIEYPKLKGFTTSPATVPIQYANNCNVTVNSTLYDRLDDCTTVIPNGGFIDIPRDEFYVTMYVNGTDYPIGILTDSGFAMDYYSEDKQKWIPVRYEFTNDAMDKLWNVRIVNNQPTENRVFIDYMNTQEITAVGQTVSLDPSVTTPLSEVAIQDLNNNSGTFFGGTLGCRNIPTLAFTDNFFWQHLTLGGQIGGRYNICTVPVLTFDMATVPDDGSVLQIDFSYDVTSQAMANPANHRNLWFIGGAEDIRGFDGTDAGYTVYEYAFEPSPFAENIQLGSFTSASLAICGGVYPCTLAYTATDPHPITDVFELRLESGIDWIILSGCNWFNGATSPSAANGCGSSYASSSSLSNTWQGDESTILLEITWEIFTPTSAPNNLTCAVIGSDLFLDFEPPSNLGGTTLTGYEIDRSSGGSFQNIAIVGVSPSSYLDDSGILAGILYTYRVYATNDLGRGAFAEIGCGLAGLPSDPFGLTATGISLGVVALDWNEPSFTGNTVITGYQIDRTTGSPPPQTNDWTFVQHKREGSDTVTAGGEVRILNQFEDTGFWRSGTTNSDSTIEGLLLSTDNDDDDIGIGHTYLFKDFAKEDLANKSIELRWDQFKKPAGLTLETSGDWETRAWIADGVYDMTQANEVGASGTFKAGVSGTYQNLFHVPSVGNGIIYDCFSNAQVQLGGNPITTTLPNTGQMESTNQHLLTCAVDNLSGASQDRVTFVFQLYDNQPTENDCGVNCGSSGSGLVVMDYIDIKGLKKWDFVDDIPVETEITFDCLLTTCDGTDEFGDD